MTGLINTIISQTRQTRQFFFSQFSNIYSAFCEIRSVLNSILSSLEPFLYLGSAPSTLSACFTSVGWSHSAQRNHKCYSEKVLAEHKIPGFFFPSPLHRHHYFNRCHRGAHHSHHHFLKSFCSLLL